MEKYSLKQLMEMVMSNQIEDAKTIIALMKAEKLLKQRGLE